MRSDERFHYDIALTRRDGQRFVRFRRRIGSLWKAELEEPYEGTDIVFGVEADPARYRFYYERPNGERTWFGSGECSLLSTETAGGFTGVYFGMYATGNGSACAAPAHFDWFRYRPGANS
ncbi:hypothetical protein [Paenibacillus sp.]|uniref:beta-xylosidase family glycoside hydrolase n=1 Tax=Paenibacillus sp. TaxID=58172 RepID=UPI002D694E11|nr:hypothetical protein [Paenibacillus sp.]HZG86273.1 hypothetical protein [Paenibacillus sp.]